MTLDQERKVYLTETVLARPPGARENLQIPVKIYRDEIEACVHHILEHHKAAFWDYTESLSDAYRIDENGEERCPLVHPAIDFLENTVGREQEHFSIKIGILMRHVDLEVSAILYGAGMTPWKKNTARRTYG